MLAAVIEAPGRIGLRKTSLPEPDSHSVRVRLEGCGICGSNLPVWEGRPWFQYPLAPGAPGHEGWGIIDAVGSEVDGWTPGERVAFLSYHAFAEYDIAPADSLIRLPSTLNGRPFPAEPLGCAWNVFRRSEVRAGQTVAVVGIGFLGALVTALASGTGARVIAISRRSFALELARQCGATELIPMDDHQRIIERVKELTGGRGCDCVIEAVGHQWPLDLASELVCERGRLVIAGYHQDGPRHVNLQLWNWRGLDVINAHERDPKVYLEGMRAAADAVASGKLNPFPLFTHQMSLPELGPAMDAMRDRPDRFMKALVAL